ncbi:MAG: hypothetical protein FJ144_12870 [Deltaproteobacteria bacterium]|nr:hypothetical protein [Deltaproteobacteria bacterium]
MSLPATAGAQAIGEPDVTGDQLIFIYDARQNRNAFLSVANPSNGTIFVDVAFYDATVALLTRQTIELSSAANLVIDATSFGGGAANGTAGLVVMTPVVAADNLQPVVPPTPLTGVFTLANLQLASGIGQNPFARLAVDGSGNPAAPGTAVDGSSVSYELFNPTVLVVPTYFDPSTLGPPENDGNRILLAAFDDQYGVPFGISARTDNAQASFFNNAGVLLTTAGVQINGVLLTDLQAVAGGTNLDGASGKVFFDVNAGDGNIFGLFGQSVGTFAAGQVMPAVAAVPEGTNQGPVIDCPGGTATISANITSSQVWPSSCTILLNGTIFVDDGAVLTIQAGTTVMGMRNPTNPPPSALVFRRGSQINANGTASSPIVFTSDQPEGARAPGDWAGLALNGSAPVNCPGGECEAEGLVDTPFGGNNSADSSGTVRYVRVEFAGRELAPDNELNVFTMNGIGSGTTIEYVQAHMGLDDAHEWFGGTVNARYLVGTGAADDIFDWQIGYTGAAQYLYGAFYGGNMDAEGSRNFEGDNNEDGFDFEPRSNPKFCNATLIGSKGQGGGDVPNECVFIRRGTLLKLGNSIVTQCNTTCFEMRDEATADQACDAQGDPTGETVIQDSIFFDCGADGQNYAQNHSSTAAAPCQSTDLFADWQANNGLTTNDPGLPAECDEFGCTPIPTGDVSSDFNCSSLDPFLQNTNYVGAFAPGASGWANPPWVSYATN